MENGNNTIVTPKESAALISILESGIEGTYAQCTLIEKLRYTVDGFTS